MSWPGLSRVAGRIGLVGCFLRLESINLCVIHMLGSGTARDPSLSSHAQRGRLVASLLSGAWRSEPLPSDISRASLSVLVPSLLRNGGSPLAWWRLARSELKDTSCAQKLRDAYRLSLIWSSIRESQLVEAYKYLRSKGVEPLLAKGWAAARLYPKSGLRPYGDLDLLVKPEHHSMALDALDSPQANARWSCTASSAS